MRHLRFGLLTVVAIGCAAGADAGDNPSRGAASVPCDSSRAAQVAMDSLAHRYPFRSEVYRFAKDSTGIRIVTWPDRTTGALILDGMAVVHLDRTCHITSLALTDSA